MTQTLRALAITPVVALCATQHGTESMFIGLL